MVQELKDKVEQSRREGLAVFDLESGPIRLDALLQFVQDIFPNHSLHQLAITEAEDGEVVIAAELSVGTKAN